MPGSAEQPAHFPGQGRAKGDVLGQLKAAQTEDVDWRRGRSWAFVYFADQDLLDLVGDAYRLGMSTNGLSTRAFRSLGQCEGEVLDWLSDLLGGSSCGSMTSGGSESILLAVKTARDYGRATRGGDASPSLNIVAPRSAHPGFAKAAHYLGLELRQAPLGEDQRVNVAEMAELVDSNTVLLVASAPSYPYGVVDDVRGVASVARAGGVPCHVDACVGGMFLPFARDLGRWSGEFDFAVPGVTSMSVDLHKFGYAAKGASAVLYRDKELFEFQGFDYDGWPGGRYFAPNLCGTRPGGAIAAAWATLSYLGREGYDRLVTQALDATDRIVAGIGDIDGLYLPVLPDMCLVAIADRQGRTRQIVSQLTRRGWALGLQGDASRGEAQTFHLTVTAGHLPFIGEFLDELTAAVRDAGDAGTGDKELGRYN